jgi:hypothetical protein
MQQGRGRSGCCPRLNEILDDLIEQDLLNLQPGERLWKLYCFYNADHPTGLRHRVYTKVKQDGRLSLLTFAAHEPYPETKEGGATGNAAGRVRSALARVADLSPADLDRLISSIRHQDTSDACEEIDLSPHSELEKQIDWLRSRG